MKASPPNPATRSGFTLIELLVVVTIIAILLALMMPGLEKAIYHAELVSCQANLHSASAGMVAYGMSYKKWYPYRQAVHDTKFGYYQPRSITVPFNSAQTNNLNGYDDRPLYQPFFDLDKLVCAPAGKVTIKYAQVGTYVNASYNIWAGWKYHGADKPADPTVEWKPKATSGMLKVGDRLHWDGRDFSILMGDVSDVIWTGWTSAHPDDKGILAPFQRQDEPWTDQNRAGRADPDARVTEAGWFGGVFEWPGRVDMNFVWDDLSSRRLDRMHWDGRDPPVGWPWPKADPRIAAIPSFANTDVDNYNVSALPIGR